MTALCVGVPFGVPQRSAAQSSRCDTVVHLMAVVHNSRQPDRSFAMVVRKGQRSRIVRRGSRVDGRPVLAVLPRALVLGPVAAPCVLRLQHEGAQVVQPQRVAPRRTKRRKR